jgi:RNA polymerase sigma factor (TIGR02999 family)
MSDVTRILAGMGAGDPHAGEQLLPLVYDELRRLAAQRLAHEPAGQTLQPTALVHEAYVRLVDQEVRQRWNTRGHFFAAAAEAMRRILVENARRKQSLKRGGDLHRLEMEAAEAGIGDSKHDLLAVNEVLEQFERADPQKAQLVKLRFFAGLSEEEAAATLGISRATAARHWAYAKAWLYARLREPES